MATLRSRGAIPRNPRNPRSPRNPLSGCHPLGNLALQVGVGKLGDFKQPLVSEFDLGDAG